MSTASSKTSWLDLCHIDHMQDQLQQCHDSSAKDGDQAPNDNNGDDRVDMSGPVWSGPLDSLEEDSHNKNVPTVDSIAVSPETIQVRLWTSLLLIPSHSMQKIAFLSNP